jgi:Holliday junction resolvasome RuvABC endonuclease subunit
MLEDGSNHRCKSIDLKSQIGFGRLQSIAYEFDRTVEIWKPDFAVIEGYAFVKNIDSFVRLVEVGTVMRQILHKRKIPWVDVDPRTLKKWTTGIGAADKELMAKAVFEKWGFKNPNTDLVDGYALARLGSVGLDSLKSWLDQKSKSKRKKS